MTLVSIGIPFRKLKFRRQDPDTGGVKRSLSLFAVFLLVACSGTPGVTSLSRAPASEAVKEFDRGELMLEPSVEVKAGPRRMWRVFAHGPMTLTFKIKNPAGAELRLQVEGPLEAGSATAANAGAVLWSRRVSVASFAGAVGVTEAGLYRLVVAADFPGQENAAAQLTASCEGSGCYRPSLPLNELLKRIVRHPGGRHAKAAIEAKLAELIPDAEARKPLVAQLDAVLENVEAADVSRFPTFPLKGAAAIRSAFSAVAGSTHSPAPVARIEGTLEDLVGPCRVTDEQLPPIVHPGIPELRYGFFRNPVLSDCEASQSGGFARVMSALAAANGSVVEYAGRRIETADDLVRALIANGHEVFMRDERTYADFLSFTWGRESARWPVWLATGIDDITLPMGHSQHAWYVRGPAVQARVAFFLGTDGVGFFPITGERPGWTGGLRPVYRASSKTAKGREVLLKAVKVAGQYYRRIRVEAADPKAAGGMPSEGYGYLGVCNDSSALIEKATRGTVTSFPLVRAAALDRLPPRGDGLDESFLALPHDGDVMPKREDLLRRLKRMQPYGASSERVFDEGLRKNLERLGVN